MILKEKKNRMLAYILYKPKHQHILACYRTRKYFFTILVFSVLLHRKIADRSTLLSALSASGFPFNPFLTTFYFFHQSFRGPEL